MTADQISLVFGAFSAGALVGFGFCMFVRFLASAWRGFVRVVIDD